MSGNRIRRLKQTQSFVIEFIVKPLLYSGAFLISPWLRYAAPIKQETTKKIMLASEKATLHHWKDSYTMRWKMHFFSAMFAHFLEADNAYLQFFLTFNKEFEKLRNLK